MTADVLRKDQLEKSLFEERQLISSGELGEDNPLDKSPAFLRLCEAARRGDLKTCQEAIQEGANINASDEYNYTPLILASLCGHYEVVHLLLETGALCERDTFQGERCLYNALNDRIRNLLLEYDYSKSTDPLQPYAAHVTSLLTREAPYTADFVIFATSGKRFATHKFVLAARSPYFRRKLEETPALESWTLPNKIPPPALQIALRYLYLGELPRDVGGGRGNDFSEEEILEGIDRIARLFEIQNLMQRIVDSSDRRVQRQQRQAEVERGRTQIESWFKEHSLAHKVSIDTSKANQVKWSKDNAIFADILLRADEEPSDELTPPQSGQATPTPDSMDESSIPIGPVATPSAGPPAPQSKTTRSVLFPVHKAMLLRGEYFMSMFSSSFLEAQDSEYLRIVPVACTPAVLENILLFFYGERSDFGLQLAVDVLFAADMLLIERLKAKAAVVISSLGNGVMATEQSAAAAAAAESKSDVPLPTEAQNTESSEHVRSEEDPLDPYATLRAAWDLRVPRLETFAARYFAYRLEKYIDQEEFVEVVQESASRIKARQETDSIELIDDIRYYLSERFRLRFEGDGLEMLNEDSADSMHDKSVLITEMEDADIAALAVEKLSLGENETGNASDRVNEIPHRRIVESEMHASDGQVIRTLDGEDVGDEFAADALNYQILMGKIDKLLDDLQLDA